MEPISFVAIGSVVIAGLVTALLPCTYPMILGIFSLLLSDTREKKVQDALISVFWFSVGFATTYAFFGSVAGLFGQFTEATLLFNTLRPALIVAGGIFFIVIGFILLNITPLPSKLKTIKAIRMPKSLSIHSWWGTSIVGVIFATGWSPCIGPVLGGALVLASTSESWINGALLLTFFSLGLMVPVVIIALAYAKASQLLSFGKRLAPYASVINGTVFIVLGILFILGNGLQFDSYIPSEFFSRFL